MKNTKKVKCEFCGKDYKSLQGLTTHLIYCKENPDNQLKKEIIEKEVIEAPEVFEAPEVTQEAKTVEETEIIETSEIIKEEKELAEKMDIHTENIKAYIDSKPEYFNQLERIVNRFKMSGTILGEDVPLVCLLWKKFTGKAPLSTTCRHTVAQMTHTVAVNFNQGKYE